MKYLSICLCHLLFLSSVSYSFLCTNLVSLQVGFSLGVLFFFVTVVNSIDYSIFISDFSLLVYGNANDFCVLVCILWLLNSLMSSSNLLIVSLGFSMYSIMSSANSDYFTSFLVWIPFISFSSLIAVARTSKTTLNNSGESGHPCLVPQQDKLWVYHIWPLLFWGRFLLGPLFFFF